VASGCTLTHASVINLSFFGFYFVKQLYVPRKRMHSKGECRYCLQFTCLALCVLRLSIFHCRRFYELITGGITTNPYDSVMAGLPPSRKRLTIVVLLRRPSECIFSLRRKNRQFASLVFRQATGTYIYIGDRCYAHARRHRELLMDSRETRAESESESERERERESLRVHAPVLVLWFGF
jgi:hypothetical protein